MSDALEHFRAEYGKRFPLEDKRMFGFWERTDRAIEKLKITYPSMSIIHITSLHVLCYLDDKDAKLASIREAPTAFTDYAGMCMQFVDHMLDVAYEKADEADADVFADWIADTVDDYNEFLKQPLAVVDEFFARFDKLMPTTTPE